MIVTVFVYGTLSPGEPAWSLLEPHAAGVRTTTVAGRLYDTGNGYPAAIFDPAARPVHGWCCEIDSSHLGTLDRFEGPAYKRVRVATTEGNVAFAYAWSAPVEGLTLIPDGRWPIGNG